MKDVYYYYDQGSCQRCERMGSCHCGDIGFARSCMLEIGTDGTMTFTTVFEFLRPPDPFLVFSLVKVGHMMFLGLFFLTNTLCTLND